MTLRLRHFDWMLVGALAVLATASLLSLASSNNTLFMRQSLWYVIAFAIILGGSYIDWRWLGSQAWFRYGLYGFAIALLVVSHLMPGAIRGTKSWISFGGMQYEPGELVKLALIFIFAHFFSRRHVDAWQSKNIFISLVYFAVPAALIITQPDIGAAFIIFCLWLGFLLVSGINIKRFSIGVLLAALLVAVFWTSFMKPYQKERITGFIFPQADPLGANYNVIQAKIAIGSAGLFGKGFGSGTQTQLRFLPEAQTDFLFAAFVEEWGILGGVVVLLTFLFIIYRIVHIGIGARDNYFKLISFGAALYFLVHFFVNIGSNLGLVPVAGVTFPFFSYGGSNLLTTAILVSIIEHTRLESSA
ncbi:MAG: FtsW/RodA/SpoVE family cell cycle protein [Candidatus Jorgensenbacteria bacterium]|nr:FtsW/RodA/SpoVE family cell cycle protein [Candidatus Jorgensenbacteria bacterium]